MSALTDHTEIVLWTRHTDGRWSGRTVWMVLVDGRAYVRSAFGRRGSWYLRVLRRADAGVEAGGALLSVTLRPVSDPGLLWRISDAYRAKYGLSWPGPAESMTRPDACAATLCLAEVGQVTQLPA